MQKEKLQSLYEEISIIADKEMFVDNDSQDDHIDISDACGGNFDDAYNIGSDDGEIYYARIIKNKLSEILNP